MGKTTWETANSVLPEIESSIIKFVKQGRLDNLMFTGTWLIIHDFLLIFVHYDPSNSHIISGKFHYYHHFIYTLMIRHNTEFCGCVDQYE